MAKKTSIKVRLVPENKPDSPYFYYVKKPSSGEKAKIKLKVKKYNPATRKHEIFIELDALKNTFKEKEKELIYKYVLNSSINMQTGEVTKKE